METEDEFAEDVQKDYKLAFKRFQDKALSFIAISLIGVICWLYLSDRADNHDGMKEMRNAVVDYRATSSRQSEQIDQINKRLDRIEILLMDIQRDGRRGKNAD